MSARLARIGAAALSLIVAVTAGAERVKVVIDLGGGSPRDWEIVSDGYSEPEHLPFAEKVVLKDGNACLGLFLRVPPEGIPSYCVLVPRREWTSQAMRLLTRVTLTGFSYQTPIRVGVLLRDGNGAEWELDLGSFNFEGPRVVEFAASLAVHGVSLAGIAVYPERLNLREPMHAAVFLKSLEIQGETNEPAGAGRP